MKAWLAALMVVASTAWADTTANLIGGTWNNTVTGAHPNNCCSGGPAPLYDPATGIIHFSYGRYAVHQAIAINQALSGSGVQINGWNWGYDLRNMNGVMGGQNGIDTINVTSFMTNNVGQLVSRSDQYFNTQFDWTTFTGTEILLSPVSLENSGILGIQFVAGDGGFWAGYYGPQIRNVSLSANYSSVPVDPCVSDPLSSPSCPGYATAYHDQQCAINALYATSCPGYQQAYYTQQCSINPLYDSGCPGYQQAYYNQQCSLDALYDNGCPNYAQAYFDQQCTANPLYDSGCANYDIVSAATQPPAQEDTTAVIAQADTTSVSSASEPTAATSATSPTSVSPAAVVSTVRPSVPAAAPAPSARAQSTENARQESRAAEQKQEQKKTDRAVARAVPRGATGRAAEKAAAEKAEEAVADAANATTIEAQQAAQNLVLGLMGYNPAFSAYQNAIVPDTNAAVMARQYNQPTVDNRRALRALSGASDSMHQNMVDQQYGRMP